MGAAVKRVGVVVFPGFQILDLAAVCVFEMANAIGNHRTYEVTLLSEHGGSVASSAGVTVQTERFSDPSFDTVLVSGAIRIEPPSDRMVKFVAETAAASRRIASICT